MKQLHQLLLIPSSIFLLGSTGNTLLAKNSVGEKGNNTGNQPNVIFFAMDDLCDWVSPLGYNQALSLIHI